MMTVIMSKVGISYESINDLEFHTLRKIAEMIAPKESK